MSTPLRIRVTRYRYDERPEHHVVAAKAAGWTSFLPRWTGETQIALDSGSVASDKPLTSRTSINSSNRTGRGRSLSRKRSSGTQKTVAYRNPWPSWHKPSNVEVWRALEWGEDNDPCIELARSHITSPGKTSELTKKQASQLLRLTKPDFDFDIGAQRAKTTWLGHAGVLVQLPSTSDRGRPIRCLFDPMFSMRASPTQTAGPIRTYPSPCTIEDLPEIDIVMISHSHFDHMDFDTISSLWKSNRDYIRFLVPLGNRQWFVDCGIDQDRVTELDWWDAVTLAQSDTAVNTSIKITCTPSQHNSGRTGTDANATLWSSWYVEHTTNDVPYRVFFAGDSGYQFHNSPGWPPLPQSDPEYRQSIAARVDDDSPTAKHPVCPAFKDIADCLGSPDLLILPIAVGATYDYFRSMTPLPDSVNPIPRHSPGLTAHNHMPPWDAVRVLNVMTQDRKKDGNRPVAIAMHWGTFMTDPVDVLKTLGQLEWACEAHEVRFARVLPDEDDDRACFLALNHGESVTT